MYYNWKETLKACQQYKDFNNWPDIKSESLDPQDRKHFNRNKNIVILVLEGMTISFACKKYGLHRSYGTYILDRCLACNSGDTPPLTAGLIPFNRVKREQRRKPLSKAANTGSRGSVRFILHDNPKMKSRLDQAIFDHVQNKKGAEILTNASFHRRFLDELENMNWPQTTYPFDRERRGYFAITRYFKSKVQEYRLTKQKKQTTPLAINTAKRVYEEIQIDEQVTDTPTSIDLYLDDNLIPLRVSRISVALAIDVASDAILDYQVCLTQHPSHEDILGLLEKTRRKWEPMNLTVNGIKYMPGSMLPSALDERVRHLQPGVIRLDNALAHHANRISNYVCGKWGSTVNYGHPASPKDRNIVEYAFRRINRLTHRFESTSGSSVTDPKRESKKNAKTPPVLKLHEFEQMLEVVITGHNMREQARLGGASPLDIIRHQLEEFPLPLNYSALDREVSAFLDERKVTVKSLKNERRAPFINFEGLRYKGAGLSNSKLIDTKINVHFDIRDIRKLEAVDVNGNSLGELLAPKTRQGFALSIRTLRRINKRARKSSGMEQKTVDRYFSKLLDGVGSSKNNMELIRVYREIQDSGGVTLPTSTSLPLCNDDMQLDLQSNFKTRNHSWQQEFLKGDIS